MKTAPIFFAVAITTAAVGGSALAASIRGPAPAAVPTETWLSIPAIHDKVVGAGFTDIDEIERERNGYKVKAVDSEGRRVKLYVDPMTGDVTDIRSKGDRADTRRSDRPELTR